MGYETTFAAGSGSNAPGQDTAVHDMRPALAARVTAGLLTQGADVGTTGGDALLLVHLDGATFGMRVGENIREETAVDAGTAAVIAAHTPVRLDIDTPVRTLLVQFDEGLLRSPAVPVLGRSQGHYALHSGLAARSGGIVAAARLLAGDMMSDEGGFAFRTALAIALIEHVAHDPALVRHREEVASEYTGAGIERALRLIEDNLAAPMSLEWLASEAGVSSYHLSRSFRRITGLNIHCYIRERRVKEACRLLAETHKPLAEIAYDCGFSSQSRMTTVFRQTLDITPLAYRQHCRTAGTRAATARRDGLAARGA